MLLAVRVAVVRFPDRNLCRMIWDAMLGVVEANFYEISVSLVYLVLLCSGTLCWSGLAGARLLGDVVQKTSLLLLGHLRVLVAQNVSNGLEERRFAASVLS